MTRPTDHAANRAALEEHLKAWDARDRARAVLSSAPQQPPGRTGLTWAGVAQGLRYVLADQTQDAIQPVWQRSRILDALELIEANDHPSAAPQQGMPSHGEIECLAIECGLDAEESDEDDLGLTAIFWQCSNSRLLDFAYQVLTRYGGQAAPVPVATSIEQWHEDNGPSLWWRFPIEEPPYAGTPLDDDWPGYHTHFTPIVCPEKPLPEAQP